MWLLSLHDRWLLLVDMTRFIHAFFSMDLIIVPDVYLKDFLCCKLAYMFVVKRLNSKPSGDKLCGGREHASRITAKSGSKCAPFRPSELEIKHCRIHLWGTGTAQWLEHWIHDQTVTGLSPSMGSGKIFFSWVNFLCWLISVSVYPHITAVARKRSQPFCQKCKWQVPAKHTCTQCMWLCMKWHDMVCGCTVYTEHAEMAAVSHGTSHGATKKHCKYTTHLEYVCLRAENIILKQ